MSNNNQWETVTKSKKYKNLEKKVVAHKEKKREEALQPKLNEILPSHQIRQLLSGRGIAGGKDISPSKSNTSSNKSKSSTPKRTSMKQTKESHQNENKKAKQEQVFKSPPKPKNLDQAFKAITPNEFQTQLEHIQLLYPGSKLSWLKAVASYLNSRLQFECDPTFSGRSNTYPGVLASPALKQAILEFLSWEGETNLKYFFHNTLLESMCTDLNNNLPVVGYKFMLQLIARNWPQICASCMASTAMLRNSYQNRSNICLSILWAVGQGGYENLMVGINVWHDLMLPNLEMKSYCRYVSEYIEKILNVASDQTLQLNQNKFFEVYNALKANYNGVPRDCQQALTRSSELFLQKFIVNSTKHTYLFQTLLREIESPTKSDIETNGCLSCLLHSDDCFKVWKMNYKKQLQPTIYLLQKIEYELSHSASSLAMSSAFNDFLKDAEQLNAELDMAKKRDSNLDTLIALVANVQEKSAQQKKKQQAAEKKKGCGCCKWTLGSLLLIALIAGALYYDTEINGKGVFAKSATGKVLQNAGLLPHVEKAWYTTMSNAARGYKWAEKTLPPYTTPFCKLACDVTKLLRNAACNAYTVTKEVISAKMPVAAQFLEQYVPGLPKKIEDTAGTVKTASVDIFDKLVSFFKTQVLVGRFSPENLCKALNQTQNLALEYYNQFHKKVDAYAKLK
ncbi:transmembrane protein 214 [Stomoxys calcitrans]|uniref:transmembrane protein 214 n=1 Tax=Stomoxys calcitrans TaxID=35570 RepID=UPI0027E39DF0|nr:transmembrane protein 214 [Stomoxys calcitrans]